MRSRLNSPYTLLICVLVALSLYPQRLHSQESPDFVPPPTPMWFHGASFEIPFLLGSVDQVSDFAAPPGASSFQAQSAFQLGLESSLLFWPDGEYSAAFRLMYGSMSMLSEESTVVQGGQTGTIHRDLTLTTLRGEVQLGYDFTSFVLDNQYGLVTVFGGGSFVLLHEYSIHQTLVSPVFASLGTESSGNASRLQIAEPFVGVRASMFIRRMFDFPIRVGAEITAAPLPMFAASTMRQVSVGMSVTAHLRTEPTRVVDTLYVRDTTSRYTTLVDTITHELLEQSVALDSALDEGVNVNYVRVNISQSWLQRIPKPLPLLAVDFGLALRTGQHRVTDSLHIVLRNVVHTVSIPLSAQLFFAEQQAKEPLHYSADGSRITSEQFLLSTSQDSLKYWLQQQPNAVVRFTSVNPDPGTVRQRRDIAVERGRVIAALLLTANQTHTTRVESDMDGSDLLEYTTDDKRFVALTEPVPDKHIVVSDSSVRSFGASLVVSPIVFSDAGIAAWEIVVKDDRDDAVLVRMKGGSDVPKQLVIDVDDLPWIQSFDEGRLQVYLACTDKEGQRAISNVQFVRITPERSDAETDHSTNMYTWYIPIESQRQSSKQAHLEVRSLLAQHPNATVDVEVFSTMLSRRATSQALYDHIIQDAPYLQTYLSTQSISKKERPTAFDSQHAVGRNLASCYVIRVTID